MRQGTGKRGVKGKTIGSTSTIEKRKAKTNLPRKRLVEVKAARKEVKGNRKHHKLSPIIGEVARGGSGGQGRLGD